jgi:hypothetical protein
MMRPDWLPAEFVPEYHRLASDMIGGEPSAEAGELLAVTAILMQRWRAMGRSLAAQPTWAQVAAADALLQTAKALAQAALTLARSERPSHDPGPPSEVNR